ncbi:MAG: sulfotransferase [Parvularcula sp.]|nr:sulfotransferase [Parvularcula sp.]
MSKIADFFVIGGTKCGTTSLYAWMSEHSGIALTPKEWRGFLDRPARTDFPVSSAGKLRGAFANGYTRDPVYPSPAQAIVRAYPEARFVYLLRDPVDRMVSHYRHRLVTGTEWRSVDRAWQDCPSYLAASRYGHQLRLYLDCVERDRMLVVRSEDLFSEPARTLQRICDFVGVPCEDRPLPKDNRAAARRTMPLALRQLARTPRLRKHLRSFARTGLGKLLAGRPPSEAPLLLGKQTCNFVFSELRNDQALLNVLCLGISTDWDLSDERARQLQGNDDEYCR